MQQPRGHHGSPQPLGLHTRSQLITTEGTSAQLPNKAPKSLLWKETVTESPPLLHTPQLAEGLIKETITNVNASCTLAHATLIESCCVNCGTGNQTNRSVLLLLSIAVNESQHVIPV